MRFSAKSVFPKFRSSQKNVFFQVWDSPDIDSIESEKGIVTVVTLTVVTVTVVTETTVTLLSDCMQYVG